MSFRRWFEEREISGFVPGGRVRVLRIGLDHCLVNHGITVDLGDDLEVKECSSVPNERLYYNPVRTDSCIICISCTLHKCHARMKFCFSAKSFGRWLTSEEPGCQSKGLNYCPIMAFVGDFDASSQEMCGMLPNFGSARIFEDLWIGFG
jgi:hypothetical protein